MPSPNCEPWEITLPGRAADDGAEHLAGNRADLELLALRRLRGAVPQRDVGDLVRHDAGDFAFRLGRLDHASIEEHRAARQREGVDVLLVHDVERIAELGVAELRRNRRDEPPTDVLDIVCRPDRR